MAETGAAVGTAAATGTVGTAAETGAAAAAAEAGVHLDLGQGDLVKGAKMHGRRCGAHEKKRDQHLECANLCPVEITFWSVAVGAYVRNLILRLRRRVREFRLRRRVREFCIKSEPRTGHTRVPDSTHNELRHTSTRKTATHERTSQTNKPHVHTHTHIPPDRRTMPINRRHRPASKFIIVSQTQVTRMRKARADVRKSSLHKRNWHHLLVLRRVRLPRKSACASTNWLRQFAKTSSAARRKSALYRKVWTCTRYP